MKSTFIQLSLFSILLLSITFLACDIDEINIDIDSTDLPACFFCENGEEESSVCYDDILSELLEDGTYIFDIGEGQETVNINLGEDDEFAEEVALWIYTAYLTLSIQNGATCFTEGPCECEEGQNKIVICHIPPGNPSNAKTKEVNCNSLDAHLAHGDFCGDCESMGLGVEINIDNIEDYLTEQYCILLGNPDPCPDIIDGTGN